MTPSIIVPTYCEAGHIAALVEALLDAAPTAEVIVVDDASPDGTAEIVRRHFLDGARGRVQLVVRDRDPGLARSIRAGVERARGDVIVVMDGDFNHKPEDVPRLLARLDALDDGPLDLVVGSRFVPGGGMADRPREWLSAAYNAWLALVLGTGVRENLSGFFAARADALRSLPADAIYFGYGDYFFRLLDEARRRGLRVAEVPVVYGARRTGRSKTRFVREFARYTVAALRQRLRVHTK